MILTRNLGPGASFPVAAPPVVVVLEATGPDPRLDQLRSLRAWRSMSQEVAFGDSERFERVFDQATSAELREAWHQLRLFAGNAPLLVHQATQWDAWHQVLGAQGSAPPLVVGVEEVERLATLRSSDSAFPKNLSTGEHGAWLLQRCLMVRKWLQLADELYLALWARGLWESAQRLRGTDAAAADRLAWILGALNDSTRVLGGDRDHCRADWLAELAREVDDVESGMQSLVPRGSQIEDEEVEMESIPPTSEGLTPFPRADKRLVQDLFEKHLPAIMSERSGGAPEDYLRPSQLEVAQRIADNLGRSGLLLMHAPTGTGKTLAYIVPALLWSLRHNLRVGVATYTRALQEQAMEGEVPRALQALARAGVHPLPRVVLLKGRENYLCWRAFTPQVPQADDDGETWLAWSVLLTFALTEATGDLDRLDTTPPVRLTASRPYREAITRLLRIARARKGCCTRAYDRHTCLADLARRRAERSHLVITNQSFVLARQEFLRHVIFDECEHLHDGAVSAWSFRFDFEDVRRTLARLHRPGRGTSRSPLDRLLAELPLGGSSREIVDRALARWERVLRALHQLEEEASFFDGRRIEATQGRNERDVHGYLRQRMQQGNEAGLLQSRLALGNELAQLERELDQVLEVCDSNPIRKQATIRRQLELGRTDLIESGKSLDACIPLSATGPLFAQEVFYDVERNLRGGLGLVARVLLPFESLGRYYYPDLESATFVSATTFLGGGFDAAKGYLGLQRAEQPAEDEERPGRPVETFRVPEVFDYSRVLIGVPRDGPPANGPRAEHRDFVADFVAQLAERTGGRMLVLFTSLEDVRAVGEQIEDRLLARGLLLLYQGMPNQSKEELTRRFRERHDSVLLGVDTFWFGADFPGDTLQYLVLARLPYGVPDRYHFAQCASLGDVPQRNQIYMPRALAKFRQGFGRLMRRKEDRGCVFVLDQRILEPRHRAFLRELPIAGLGTALGLETRGARLVRGPRDRVLREGLAFMGLLAPGEQAGQDLSLWQQDPLQAAPDPDVIVPKAPPAPREAPPRIEVDPSDLPY